jgi:hypothetical protein
VYRHSLSDPTMTFKRHELAKNGVLRSRLMVMIFRLRPVQGGEGHCQLVACLRVDLAKVIVYMQVAGWNS